MYQYTDFDRQFIQSRAAQYRDQLERNLERERQLAAQNAGLSAQEQANLAQGV